LAASAELAIQGGPAPDVKRGFQNQKGPGRTTHGGREKKREHGFPKKTGTHNPPKEKCEDVRERRKKKGKKKTRQR